jgi:UDP-4-amino-4,6-dideoxy-N-acetyl-beta-L-altrosamine transaminase
MIPYGRQDIIQSDIDAVVDVLQSDFLTQGETVPLFEKEVCIYTGAKYGVAVNSATSALHLACLALSLGKGDWLWTSPITFVASANCGLYCGAKVDFVDIDPKTYNLSTEALEEKLIQAEIKGKLPKILIPVHMCGQSCDMKKIHELSQKYGFKIIEDASHAIGGKYMKKTIGNCRFSDITVFSFHPVKIITTGEGGIALTNCASLASRMELLRSHGITRDPNEMTHAPDGPWYYQQIEMGYNYRMNDIQAALGISQLERLDYYVSSRHILADRYNILLADLPLETPYQHSNSYSSYHLYVICLKENNSVAYHRTFFESLRKKGIGVNVHYIPLYTQPCYQKFEFDKNEFPNSEKYYESAITLPLYPTMDDKTQNEVIKAIKQVVYEEH